MWFLSLRPWIIIISYHYFLQYDHHCHYFFHWHLCYFYCRYHHYCCCCYYYYSEKQTKNNNNNSNIVNNNNYTTNITTNNITTYKISSNSPFVATSLTFTHWTCSIHAVITPLTTIPHWSTIVCDSRRLLVRVLRREVALS